MNVIQTAIDHFDGNASSLARAIDVTPQAVFFWRDEKRKVPADKCPSIERETGGLVTCEQLRPDVDWAYIRGNPGPATTAQVAAETAAQQGA